MVNMDLEMLSEWPSRRQLRLLFITSILLLIIATPLVIDTLEKSGYPGELERTQLGFDADYIRNCFQSMSEKGLDQFIKGNLLDYLFMVSYAGIFFSSALVLARKLENSIGQKIGYVISLLGVFSAISDGVENIFMLSMAFNPINFPSWLSFAHSMFAHVKFKLMYATAGWIFLTLVYVVSILILREKMYH